MVTYNVLADAYIKPSWFPRTPSEVLDPGRRRAALIRHIQAMDADVLCLQELERPVFEELRRLFPHAEYGPRAPGRPDGCGTFSRSRLTGAEVLDYSDGTGHVALLTLLEHQGRRLGVANTHLRWDAPGARVGCEQLERLLAGLPAADGWIVCGDFNATSDSPTLQRAYHQGWLDPGRGSTCNANARARRIDYLLHTPSLHCDPWELGPIEDHTPLPSDCEPSDHLAVGATFRWAQGM